MTGDFTLLSDVRELPHIEVWLPDGNSAVAVQEGKLRFGDKFDSDHVLFVPTMNCTLISISKLTEDLNCSVTFTNELCQNNTVRASLLNGWIR